MPKVLYIGFGVSPFVRGGAVIYQESLMEAIGAEGWEAACFLAIPRYGITKKAELRYKKKGKINFIELYNPPYLLGASNDPGRQCSDAGIEGLLENVLDQEKPDLVHIHELQMHPASIISAIKKRNIPCVKTMHNYYDVCPQRDLMYNGQELCLDFDGGRRCVDCRKSQPYKLNIWRAARSLLAHGSYKIHLAFYGVIKSAGATTYPADDYGSRRRFFIEALNNCDAIHCSSRRSAEIFVNYGLDKAKVRIIPLSCESIEKITPKPLRGAGYPVVFGYAGSGELSKGYRILLDAFSKLDQSRAKLIAWNVADRSVPRNLNVEFRGQYDLKDINKVLEQIDVGVVPSMWEEVFGIIGIEWLTARIPVIGSDIGGIRQWLKDTENGFLARPNDAQHLAERMELFVKDPGLISRMQREIEPWKPFKEHTRQIAEFYNNIINQGYN